MTNWIIQRKIFKGDWETIATFTARNKQNALDRYTHLNGTVRAVSEVQAERDYQAGRADNWKRVRLERIERAHKPLTAKQLEDMDADAAIEAEQLDSRAQFKQSYPELADRDFVAEMQSIAAMQYQDSLSERGITEEQHLVEVMHWCDSQD